MASAPGGLYNALHEHIKRLEGDEWTASWSEIERILGFPLPPSARENHAWWANSTAGHPWANAWLKAGWRRKRLKLAEGTITFQRAVQHDMPIEPSKDRRVYLIKVGAEDCPVQKGRPALAADWEGGDFLVDLPKKAGPLPQEKDSVLIWVNGVGLLASATIREPVPGDVSRLTVGDVKLLMGKRRIDDQILRAFENQDEILREIKGDRPSRLREISGGAWRYLVALHEALNSTPELDDVERLEIARVVAAIRTRVAVGGDVTQRQNPVRTAPPLAELIELITSLWEDSGKRCALCGGHIPATPSNAMLKMSADRIDSGNPAYDASNVQIAHLACNRAKNDSSAVEFEEWLRVAKGDQRGLRP